ncbi:MAG: hypothetical protein CL521_05580 [Actinobacteria bacterium]|nr:hypothetical protein [Actinomycetota bacterium]
MSEKSPRISVVIGTYNQCDVIKKVLLEYNQQSLDKAQFEVIVVDSMSTDGTEEMINSGDWAHQLVYIRQENTGKAMARNRGVKAAKGRYIIISDADMIPHPEFVKTHLNAHLAQIEPLCFEGLTYDMSKLHWPINPALLTPYIKRNYQQGASLGWFYFLTGNISFPKTLFEKEGGFSELFTGYGWEDLELGYRFHKKKIKLRYLKSAINYHYHVISDTNEIERNVKKGLSAKVMLQLHPELKWFLGLNPLSKVVYHLVPSNSFFYRYLKEKWYPLKGSLRYRFSRWFLKEHAYLSGILSKA